MLDRSAKDNVCGAVDALREDLTKLGLDLGNIEAPLGKERDAGNYVYDWMAQHGFRPERIGAYEDRFNVIGRVVGTGGGLEPLVQQPPRYHNVARGHCALHRCQ